MMSELLIHIGYPKTGTTTLQKGIFHNLHEQGYINYIGRGSESEFLDWNDKFVRRQDINENISLSEDVLNVFSDERLTNQEFYSKMRYKNNDAEGTRNSPHSNPLTGLNHDPFDNPARVKSVFTKHADDIRILVTLRSQPKIVYSLYAYTHHVYKGSEYDSWEKYYSHFISDEYLRKDFYYAELLNHYETVFGKKNIDVVLFEFLKNNHGRYIKEIQDVLGIEKNISNITSLEPQNVTNKTNDYYINQWRKPNFLEKVFRSKKGSKIKSGVKNGLETMERTNLLKILKNVYDNIAFSEGKNQVEKQSEEQSNQIRNIYKDSNLKLTRYNNLDPDVLNKYKYI